MQQNSTSHLGFLHYSGFPEPFQRAANTTDFFIEAKMEFRSLIAE